MSNPVMRNPWVRAIVFAVVVVLAVLLAYVLRPVLAPLLLAFLAAYLLDPVVDFFERRRIPRSVTIAVLACIGVALLIAVPVVFLRGVVHEADRLAETRQVQGRFGDWVEWGVDALELEGVARDMGWIPAEEEEPDVLRVLAERLSGWVREHATELLRGMEGRIAGLGQRAGTTAMQVFSSVGKGIVGTVVFFANFALFAFVAGYLLRDFDGLIEGAKSLVPCRYREKTFDIVGQIDGQMQAFLRGQAIVCGCLGVMYGVGFLIAGTPFALLIAAFGAVASFVPYLGVTFTALVALFLTLLTHAVDWHVLAVMVTMTVAQTLEGNFLTPKIVGSKVGLNPVWVILAVLVFGHLFGLVGILAAVPAAAALKVLVVEGLAKYRQSGFFTGAGEAAKKGRRRAKKAE